MRQDSLTILISLLWDRRDRTEFRNLLHEVLRQTSPSIMSAKKMRTTKSATPETEVAIAGITRPVILNYFEALNAGQFAAAAALFAPDGVMYPPFEEGIEGPEAIADYLATEAKGMMLQPREGVTEPIEAEGRVLMEVQVTGRVQTSLFSVNVRWTFTLMPDDQIAAVTIKLLASPEELLKLRR